MITFKVKQKNMQSNRICQQKCFHQHHVTSVKCTSYTCSCMWGDMYSIFNTDSKNNAIIKYCAMYGGYWWISLWVKDKMQAGMTDMAQ